MNDPKTLRQPPAQTSFIIFSDNERAIYEAMREHYRNGRDILTEAERIRLRFIRWLYLSGRIDP
jgi:hypothetical protein